MGRDALYPAELTFAVRANAEETVRRWNLLLARAGEDGVGLVEENGSPVASGWRPRAVNEATSNAAAASTHIAGEALDGRDSKPERHFARWCLQHLSVLEEIGLWIEDPRWTWREPEGQPWVHGQIRPPHSGLRVYRPSMHEALASALPEQATQA